MVLGEKVIFVDNQNTAGHRDRKGASCAFRSSGVQLESLVEVVKDAVGDFAEDTLTV